MSVDSTCKSGIEQKIRQRIRHFDVHSLLNLLSYLGYQRSDILFQSNVQMVSNCSLLEDIEFYETPSRRAVITINTGLMHPLGPVPSYFAKAIDKGLIEEGPFLEFIRFFDHLVIADYLDSVYPENDPEVFYDWERVKNSYLHLMGLNSSKTIHWVFQLAFPELGVWLEPRLHDYGVKANHVLLGKSSLGDDAVLGGVGDVPSLGFNIHLHSEREQNETEVPWVDETHHRLHKILFPILAEVDIYLNVDLVIHSQRAWLKLSEGSYFGVDRIQGGTQQRRIVHIFHGLTSSRKH